jgi:hypothetical protein
MQRLESTRNPARPCGSADDETPSRREARDCDADLIRMAPITRRIIDAAPI